MSASTGARRAFDVVFCDIDGCLGPETHEPLDAEALARLAAHNRRAESVRDVPVVTLCSGRPQPFAEALCRLLSNTTVPVVAENGVWVYDPAGQSYHLDPAITSEHLRWVSEATAYFQAEWLPRGVIIQPGKTASISLWHPDTPFLREACKRFEERFAREGWKFRVSMTVSWVNCDLGHVSKRTGIDRVFAMSGLTHARAAGIGDSLSDLAIAERVAFFGCPSNADPRLKPHARYVSPSAEVAGVFEILDAISRA